MCANEHMRSKNALLNIKTTIDKRCSDVFKRKRSTMMQDAQKWKKLNISINIFNFDDVLEPDFMLSKLF